MPALPSPGKVIRAAMEYSNEGRACANVLHFAYSGGGLSSTDLLTCATGLHHLWRDNIMPHVNNANVLVQVNAEDLVSSTAPTVDHIETAPGGEGSGTQSISCCTLVSGQIDRRYRGGHPRIYLPAPGIGQLGDTHLWKDTFVTAVDAAFAAFLAALPGISTGVYGVLTPCQVSYFSGFTVHTKPSGRAQNLSTLRATPLVDIITAYSADTRIATQRRRLGKDID